jgi:hypothetical protein
MICLAIAAAAAVYKSRSVRRHDEDRVHVMSTGQRL